MSMPSFCNVIHRVARKQHTCTECRGHIKPLDVYERVSGCWDGEVQTFKTCLYCEQARDFYVEEIKGTWMHDPNEGDYRFTQVMQDLLDITSDIPTGDGKRFRAYRYVVEAKKRREAAKAVAQ
jgi:hypothetical protein